MTARNSFPRSAIAATLAGMLLALAATTASSQAVTAGEKAVGQTEPAARVEVPTVIRGRIAQIVAKEGQPIKAGDTIAQLDSSLQEATVKLAEMKARSQTEIDYAKVALDHAKNEFEKYAASGAVAPIELAGKKLAVQQAEAYVKKSIEMQQIEEQNWEREKLVLKQMTIKSPIDGYVHRINKQAGEAIDENQPLAVVVQTAKLNAGFFLGENYFGKIKAGDKVTVELATTPPMTREATVIAVDPFVDPAGHLFRVKMEIDNADNKIPGGITATWNLGK